MMQNNIRLSALAAAVVVFGACGETTEIIGDELTEAEAAVLAEGIVAATFMSADDVPATAPSLDGPATVPFSFSSEMEADLECELGGMVSVAASFEVEGDTESEAGSAEFEMTQIHDGCVVEGEDEVQFTLWGNPSLAAAFSLENNGEGVVEWGGSIEGTVDWASGDREGTCSVDLEFGGRLAHNAEEESIAGDLEGSICGVTLLREFSIG